MIKAQLKNKYMKNCGAMLKCSRTGSTDNKNVYSHIDQSDVLPLYMIQVAKARFCIEIRNELANKKKG